MRKVNRVFLITLLFFCGLFFLTKTILSKSNLPILPIKLFPLENYNSNVDAWINASQPDYNKKLVTKSYQNERTKEFCQHLLAPWNSDYVYQELNQTNNTNQNKYTNALEQMEKSALIDFDNTNKEATRIGYAENFRPHPKKWIDTLAKNIDFTGLTAPLKFNEKNRAIIIKNSNIRALPTNDVYFFDFTISGEGYPFDQLQLSATWTGTPIYIIATTKDQSWSLILTPEVIGWVSSENIAKVDSSFVKKWQQTANNKLAAIINTKTNIIDSKFKTYYFSAYVGSVFPVQTLRPNYIEIIVPILQKNKAVISYALVKKSDAVIMPFLATAHNFAKILKTLIERPYGWGGIYFYNDCSAELKALYTPFGIWLPRHSSNQVSAGKLVDKSSATIDERLNYLKLNGHKLMTIIYLGKHVILYAGNYPNPDDKKHKPIVLTYQQTWGLAEKNANIRHVIGQSVFIPLLKKYPNHRLRSQASGDYFQVSFLDQFPTKKT